MLFRNNTTLLYIYNNIVLSDIKKNNPFYSILQIELVIEQ